MNILASKEIISFLRVTENTLLPFGNIQKRYAVIKNNRLRL